MSREAHRWPVPPSPSPGCLSLRFPRLPALQRPPANPPASQRNQELASRSYCIQPAQPTAHTSPHTSPPRHSPSVSLWSGLWWMAPLKTESFSQPARTPSSCIFPFVTPSPRFPFLNPQPTPTDQLLPLPSTRRLASKDGGDLSRKEPD